MVARVAVLTLVIVSGCAQGQSGPRWDLIVPPLTANGFADQSAPLPQWQNAGNYGARSDCKAALQQGQFAAGANFGPITRAASSIEDGAAQIMSGQCVSSDASRFAAH